jgi:hypothetical protein
LRRKLWLRSEERDAIPVDCQLSIDGEGAERRTCVFLFGIY